MGGGYDIYSGIPLYFTLKKMGKEVVLANLSFTFLAACGGEKFGSNAWIINKQCNELDYFPERVLYKWLLGKNESPIIFAFSKTGVLPLKETYKEIIEQYKIDTLILVDGGTDSLMRGNEAGLGTPAEDMTSLVAGYDLSLDTKILLTVGFGIDHFHGVCHSQFLENVADLVKEDVFYGVNTITKTTEIGQLFLDLGEYANERARGYPSIVVNSVASAVEGKFGNYHANSPDQLENLAKKLIKLAGKSLDDIDGSDSFSEQARYNYGYALVIKALWRTFHIDQLVRKINNKRRIKFNWQDALKLMVAERINEPCSKLSNSFNQSEYFGLTQDGVALNHLYKTLDVLSSEKPK